MKNVYDLSQIATGGLNNLLELYLINFDVPFLTNEFYSFFDILRPWPLKLEVEAVVEEALQLAVLSIVADAYYWSLGVLDYLNKS